MAVRIKVGEQLRISSRPSRWGTVKAVYKAMAVRIKEVIKEQPTPTNLSATARRVLQCTRSH